MVRAAAKKREKKIEEGGFEKKKEMSYGFDHFIRWKAKQCWFWLKFDVVTPCKVIFNPNSFDI